MWSFSHLISSSNICVDQDQLREKRTRNAESLFSQEEQRASRVPLEAKGGT